MPPVLEISFRKSPSPNYTHAVNLAQTIPGYRKRGDPGDILHTITWSALLTDEAAWEKLHRLLAMILGWRSVELTLDGRPLKIWSFAMELTRIKACHARRVQAGTGDLYCSGKSAAENEGDYFGCRHARGVSRQASTGQNSWVRFGTLSKKQDSFRVDKKTIRETLETQTKGEVCLFCPAFAWRRLRADVNALPDVVNLGEKSAFELRYSELDPSKVLGLKPKTPPTQNGWVGATLTVQAPLVEQPKRQVPNVRYDDVAGQDAALSALRSVVELPLCHSSYFEALGVAPQNGVILYGPPGNGKTLLAKAVATQSNAHLEIISGPEILSKWLGQSEANLRQIFSRARQLAPSVVLIDELDSLAPRRALLSHQHDVQLLSQLLVLLDGLESRGQVAVVATTNRLEAIDPAVCRPGRFDYHIEVGSPDHEGRLAILRVHLSKLKHRDFRIDELVQETDGYSGAELAALCREAGLQAIQRGLARGVPANRLVVKRQDMSAALEALQAKRVNLESR